MARTYTYCANKYRNSDRIHNVKLTTFKSNELNSCRKFSSVGERLQKIISWWYQRLGNIKALIAKPKPLIFEEATSLIGSQIKNSITKSTNSISGNSTLIAVAHKLPIVRNSNVKMFPEDRKVFSTESFVQENNSLPNFFTSKTHRVSNS